MKKDEKKKSTFGYFLGCLAIGAGALLVIPKVVEMLSSAIYNTGKTIKKPEGYADEQDWGPVIEKKPEAQD